MHANRHKALLRQLGTAHELDVMEKGALFHELLNAAVAEEVEMDADEGVEVWAEGGADLTEVVVTDLALAHFHFVHRGVEAQLCL